MIGKIENEYLVVEAESAGAQLKSIRSKKTGKEYLWQGDPLYWTGRAYNLFPIIGRMINNQYTYGGKTYEMLLHGFVRRSELALTENTENSMTFSLSDSEVTREQYPFAFRFSVTYTLEKNKLSVTLTVENREDKEIIFGVGGHPGFNVPFDGGAFEDYFVEFPNAGDVRQCLMSDDCFMTGEEPAYPLTDRAVALRHDLFDRDAIVLKNTGGLAVVKGKHTKDEIRFSYPDLKYMGLWHKPKTQAPFLCLEPWSALPASVGKVDAFEIKRDMTHLPAGETYTNTYSIEIVES